MGKGVQPFGFAIRAITAGENLRSLDDVESLERAIGFLHRARRAFESEGLVVQGLRVAAQPLAQLFRASDYEIALRSLERLDKRVDDADVDLSLGPLIEDNDAGDDLPVWAARLAATTRRTFWSATIASRDRGIHEPNVELAAATIARLSRVGEGGEANFRFAAAAGVPASTPFFPVAYHQGPSAFSLALESAALVAEAFTGERSPATASRSLVHLLTERLRAVATVATRIADNEGRNYAGIDLSPAPSLDASIAEPIEGLSGVPFGQAGTLTACAAITEALHSVGLRSCGYCGLMLPVLEDRLLARRAAEGRLGLSQLLLFSSVCGTGLDVVPLPGNCGEAALRRLLMDVATLSVRWRKPLAARLLPIPGKAAGEAIEFANPHLTASVVLGTEAVDRD